MAAAAAAAGGPPQGDEVWQGYDNLHAFQQLLEEANLRQHEQEKVCRGGVVCRGFAQQQPGLQWQQGLLAPLLSIEHHC